MKKNIKKHTMNAKKTRKERNFNHTFCLFVHDSIWVYISNTYSVVHMKVHFLLRTFRSRFLTHRFCLCECVVYYFWNVLSPLFDVQSHGYIHLYTFHLFTYAQSYMDVCVCVCVCDPFSIVLYVTHAHAHAQVCCVP